MGHVTTCFFQCGEGIVFFLSLHSTLSLSLFWDACRLEHFWQNRHIKAQCCHLPINEKIDLAFSFVL